MMRSMMLSRYAQNMFLIIFYFIVLSLVAFNPLSEKTLEESCQTVYDVIRVFGDMDKASYSKGALSIFENGWFGQDKMWMINLWPPGFFVIQAAILFIVGVETNVVVGLKIVTCLVWSLAFFSMSAILYSSFRKKFVFLVPLIFLFFPLFHIFFKREVLHTEPISIGLLCCGFGFSVMALDSGQRVNSSIAGLMFALAAYIRNSMEFFMLVFCVIAIIYTLLICIVKLFSKSVNCNTGLIPAKLHAVFIVIAVFMLVTIPYRIYRYQTVNSISWTSVLTFAAQWIPSKHYEGGPGQFLINGQCNTACLLDPDLCERIYLNEIQHAYPYSGNNDYTVSDFRRLALFTFLSNPIKWVLVKAQILPKFWFSSGYFENLVYAIFLLCAIIYSLYGLATCKHEAVSLLILSFIFANIATLIFFHVETRYFYPPKMLFAYLAPIIVAKSLQKNRSSF